MSKQRILIFLLGISVLILAHTNKSKSSHSCGHRHHRHEKEPNPHELQEQSDYESFIQHFSLPFLDLDNILGMFNSGSKKPKENEPKVTSASGMGVKLKTDTSDKNNNNFENAKKPNGLLKETNTKAGDTSKSQHSKFYSDLNNKFVKSRRQHIVNEDVVKPTIQEVKKNEIGGDDFSLGANLHDVSKSLADMQAEQEKKGAVEIKKTPTQTPSPTQKPAFNNKINSSNNGINNNKNNDRTNHILRSSAAPSSPQSSEVCDVNDEEALAFKDRLNTMNIYQPYSYSKKTYDMNATEDTLCERLKAFNGNKSFNKDSKNVAIAKANNSFACAKGNGPGKAIASSSEGGAATAISLGGGDAISEVKHNGRATAVAHGKGSSTAKSHGQGVSEAISKGDGKALAISSDNSYSRAVAIGNSNSTALSSDDAIALSLANSQAYSDAQAANNSTSIANSNSRANSLAVATDHAFANATANANSVALSTASQNSIANSNANSDAEALAKASGNGITQVLANANSQAIAESKDNSVVIVESSANSKAAGESNSPVLPCAAPNASLMSNKPLLKLRGSDFNRNRNFPSFLMIKKIEIPSFQDNRNMFDYLNMNLDDDASVLVNANSANGGIFSLFSGSTPSQNATAPSQDSACAANAILTKTTDNANGNNNTTPSNGGANPIEATKHQIIEAIINAPVSATSPSNEVSAEKKPVLTETTAVSAPSSDLKTEAGKQIEANSKIDLSRLDTQSDFVKDLIKKINNEDCILNYDAGPIFNTNAKKPESPNSNGNNNNNNPENISDTSNSIPKVNENAQLQQQQQQINNNDNNLAQGNQTCGVCGSESQRADYSNRNGCDESQNKSFLKETENGVDKNASANLNEASPETQNVNNLMSMPSGPDGMVIDKQNNRIIVDDTDGKNKNIKIDQSLNFSKNQVNRNFNSQNSDFKIKNTVEHLSGKEAKCAKDAEATEDEEHESENESEQEHGQEQEEKEDFDLESEFEDGDENKRKNRGERRPARSFKSRRDAKSKSKPKTSSEEAVSSDIEDFDRKYFKSGKSTKRGKSAKDSSRDSRKLKAKSGRNKGSAGSRDEGGYSAAGDDEERAAFREARKAGKKIPSPQNNFLNTVNEAEKPEQRNKTNNNNNKNDNQNQKENESEEENESASEIDYKNLKGNIPSNNIINSGAKQAPQTKQSSGSSGEEEYIKQKSAVSTESPKDKIHSIWTNTEFKAVDVACSIKGDIMAIGEDKKLYKYDLQKNSFDLLKQEDELSNLKNIDLGSDATPFAITENGNTYFLDSKSNWIRLPGCATDISIGKNGEIFKLGCTNRPRGYSIYQFSCAIEENSSRRGKNTSPSKITKNLDNYLRNYYKNLKCRWNKIPGFAKTIVVGNDGLPFIISRKNNFVYKSDGKYWDAVSGVKAKDISVSNENVLFIVGVDGKIYEVFNDKDSEVVLFDSISADKISTGPYSRPSIIKSADGLVYTSSKI